MNEIETSFRKKRFLSKRAPLSAVTICLGLYFMMMSFDNFSVFGLGSLLRLISLLPIGAVIFIKLRSTFIWNSMSKMLLLYCAYMLVTLPFSVNLDASFSFLRRIFLNLALVMVVSFMYEYTDREISFLKKCLVIGGLTTILLTLVFADYSLIGRITLSVNGQAQDQNYLNGYLFFAYIFFFWELVKNKRLPCIALVGGILYFTLATGSRGSLIALICISMTMIFYLLFTSGKGHGTVIFILLLLVLFCLLYFGGVMNLLPESVSERFSLSYILQHGFTGRFAIWRYLIHRFYQANIFRSLFGFGFGTTAYVNEYNYLVAHNLFLDHLIMGGMVGLLLFLCLQLTFFLNAWRTKDIFVIAAYVGYLVMMCSLSIYYYKPLFNAMIMICLIRQNQMDPYIVDDRSDGGS